MSQTTWAVVIGIDRYWDASASLKGAVKDAVRMHKWLLSSEGGQVPTAHMRLLLEPSSSAELPQDLNHLPADSTTIINVIREIFRKNSGNARSERLFFYFSGHGLTARINFSDEPALLPSDFTPDKPTGALKLRGIVEYLEATHIREQFFFIDACRNVPWHKEFAISDWPWPEKMDPSLLAPQQFVLYATSPGVRATEIQQAANERGTFTDALVRGLEGDTKARQWDDASEKYLVTVNSLFDFVSAEVSKAATTAGDGASLVQIPRMAGEHGAVGKRANNPVLASFDVPFPTPDPKCFSIGLAHLENDEDRELEKFIVDALMGFEGVEVLRLGRPILLEGIQPRDRERAGHEKALKYLTESGADVMIWGTKLELGGKVAARLYWTTSSKNQRPKSPYVPDNFKLPEIFWSDLVDILGLRVITQASEFSDEEGFDSADKMQPFIEKVRQLLAVAALDTKWSEEALAEIKFVLANGLHVLGENKGDTKHLEEVVSLYREVLAVTVRDRYPQQWAATQNGMAAALFSLGERESSVAQLEEALAAFRAALTEFTKERERSPLDWARTQNNLGNVLTMLAWREPTTNRLKEAITAYRKALEEATQERAPLEWALTQTHLAHALTSLGRREPGELGMKLFEEAVNAHREALKECTRAPRFWATIQGNLGNTLRTIGEHGGGTRRLSEAVEAYREALKEEKRESTPVMWAAAQDNLGIGLASLGMADANTALLEEAVNAHREALKERTQERFAVQWAVSKYNLGNALKALGELEGGTTRLNEAIIAYREALNVFTCEESLDWFMTRNQLGIALRKVSERERETTSVEEAVDIFRGMLLSDTCEKWPTYWAQTQVNLGGALFILGQLQEKMSPIEDAEVAFRKVLTRFGADTAVGAAAHKSLFQIQLVIRSLRARRKRNF